MQNENLDLYLNEFADLAVVQINGLPVSVSGIFDEVYIPVYDGATSSRHITFSVISSAIVGLHHGDMVEVLGETFTVIDIQPIDDGKFSDLVLKRG